MEENVLTQDMELINRLSRKKLAPEEVYTFSVKLCDNEVDRDGERFDREALVKLAELFVGKSGLFDHAWSAEGQTARIYKTEVVDGDGVTAAGDRYCYCKGWAYMLRSEKNAELIAEIEGGIKKEVSVGCAAARSVCSICGGDIGSCTHERGEHYNGKLCYAQLCDITDAYEWSFVAVPAQRQAGVLSKRFSQGEGSLRALTKRYGTASQLRELERLEKDAQLGRSYLGALRKEVARLMLTAEEMLDGELVEKLTRKLGEGELKELERAFSARVGRKLGLAPQIVGGAGSAGAESDFRI